MTEEENKEELLGYFAINEELRVMPAVIDRKWEQDRNKQVYYDDYVTQHPDAARCRGNRD